MAELPKYAAAVGDGNGGSSSTAPPPPFAQAQQGSQPQSVPAAAQSTPAQAPVFRTRFACVTLNRSDRIRFIGFDDDDVAAMRGTIQAAWTRGIDAAHPYGKSQEFKLYGNPWSRDSWGSDTDGASRLLRRLLEGLFDRGWVLQASVDMIKKSLDKDTLVFRYQSPPPPPCEWLSVEFYRRDRLRFVERPPPDLAAAVISALGRAVSSHETAPSRLEIKFYGSPWWPSGLDTVTTRLLLLKLLEVLETFGFSLYASIDHQSSSDGNEADLLILHRQRDWVPGAPIFHR